MMADPNDAMRPMTELETEPSDDALVRRLRQLQWPTVKPDVRDRCWETFAARVANNEPLSELPEPSQNESCPKGDGRRESYTRRQLLPREPLGGYSHAPRPWMERPSRSLALSSR